MKTHLQGKRGQAALEFLMTYGWAVLVVLVVIGTLAYFGVLNPSFLLPEKCTLQIGLQCKDHRIDLDDKSVSMRLENGFGKGIIITRVKVSNQANTILCDVGIGSFTGVFPTPGCNETASGDARNPAVNCAACGALDWASLSNPDASIFNVAYKGNFTGCHPHPDFESTFNGNAGWLIQNTQDGSIKIPCEKMTQAEGKTKVDVVLVYFFDDSGPQFSHTMQGELLAKLETLKI